MKKYFLAAFLVLAASTLVYAGNRVLYLGNVHRGEVKVVDKVFTFRDKAKVSLSIPCNVEAVPTFILGSGRNYAYKIFMFTNTTSISFPKSQVPYELHVTALSNGKLVITEVQ